MIVSKIELRNVTVHKMFALTLPKSGVVLVTGPNGSGKSTIVEGVSVAAWGKPLRGKSVWTDEEGQIVLHTDELRIDKRKGSLKFDDGEEPEAKFDTTTKAQEALDARIPSWDVWRRSCVFSSRDSAHFTEAGDADRKRLLESILNLDALDDASALVRKDLKKLEAEFSAAEHKAELLEQKISLLTREQSSLAQAHAQAKPAVGTAKDTAALIQAQKKLQEEIRETEAPLNEVQEEIGKKTYAVEQAKATAVKINAYDTCPTCLQKISVDHKRRMIEAAELVSDANEDALKDFRDQKSELGTKLKGLRYKLDKTQQQLTEAKLKNLQLQETAANQRALEARVAEHKKEIEESLDAQDEVSVLAHDLRTKLATLGVVDKVLSTRGLRAHLLHNALSFVEQTANHWLGRIAGRGLALHLTPYAEKSTGGTRDVIGLEVEGAGGGNGYKGASGGERRRIDIALMLALSEVARVSSGEAPGTLFFDEVLDALDSDGVAAVIDVVSDLAQDRAVVIISHNEDVVNGLRNIHEHVKLERTT